MICLRLPLAVEFSNHKMMFFFFSVFFPLLMQETETWHLFFCVYIDYNLQVIKSCNVLVLAQMMPIPLASLSQVGDVWRI
jgi:threonine/homoserine/homoserine lactone efflux protein